MIESTVTIPCKICEEPIVWDDSIGAFTAPKPFPICNKCLDKLKVLIDKEDNK